MNNNKNSKKKKWKQKKKEEAQQKPLSPHKTLTPMHRHIVVQRKMYCVEKDKLFSCCCCSFRPYAILVLTHLLPLPCDMCVFVFGRSTQLKEKKTRERKTFTPNGLLRIQFKQVTVVKHTVSPFLYTCKTAMICHHGDPKCKYASNHNKQTYSK